MSESQTEPTTRLIQTPSQTIGPFFGFALPYEGGPNLVPGHHPQAIRLHGTVTDGAGDAIPDAMLEIWQADAAGRVAEERGSLDRDGFSFTGFGRVPLTLGGHFTFTTVKPGSVGGTAPYILVTIFARGLTHHLFTRIYFPEDAELHMTDRVLTAVGPDRSATLIAVAEGLVGGSPSYRFDIRIQGEGETVFLDFDSANGIEPADHPADAAA